MGTTGGSRGVAALLAVAAAFLWATYYIFVLAISPATRPAAILALPFVVGGLAYSGWAVAEREGAAYVRMWAQPEAWLRTGLLVTMQLSVLAATYLTGPVDASLLSLIGDVVATPILVALLLGAHRAQIRSVWFALGLLLSLAGGSLTIAGGQRLAAIPPLGWLAVPAVPLSVAAYFLLAARANEKFPSSAVVGQSMLASGLVTAVLAPAIPGGAAGLVPPDPISVVVLVALGLTSFFLAPVLYFSAIRRAGYVLPPMLMTGIPVFTLLLSGIVLRLGLPFLAVLGIPVAVVGALLTFRGETASEAPPVDRPGPTS